jgi:2,4-dienoyl-CoA reductase-like NADH-dependent reductase (Old Yellow Enzyme family)
VLISVILSGNSDVRYPEAARNACLDRDQSPKDIVEKFARAIKAAKAHGSLAILQLTHAG